MCGCKKSDSMDLGILLQGYDGMGDLDPNAILSPSRDTLQAETDRLGAAIKQLSADWLNSYGNNVSQTQLQAYRNFVSDFNSWNWGPAIVAHIIGTSWRDDLLVYQSKFNDFANQWRAAGVSTSVPDFNFKEAPPGTLERLANKATAPIADAASVLKWGVLGVAGTIVGYVFFLTWQTGKVGRAIAPGVARNPRRRRARRR